MGDALNNLFIFFNNFDTFNSNHLTHCNKLIVIWPSKSIFKTYVLLGLKFGTFVIKKKVRYLSVKLVKAWVTHNISYLVFYNRYN